MTRAMRPGWPGRYFHSATMTFAHYDFARGSSIHEYFHAEEEIYEVIEGEFEVTINRPSSLDCDRAEQCPSLGQGPDRRASHRSRSSSQAGFHLD
jgi:hypothetical protein